MTHVAYIAVGSNIEPRVSYLRSALQMLNRDVNISILKCSSVYETVPIGFVTQADFLNMVIKVLTKYSPLELLEVMQTTERALGRKREVRWGPRTLDLDILLYNQENIEMEQLLIPHPRMGEREFVMVPLNEIDPDLYLFQKRKTVKELTKELPNKEGVRVWMEPFGEEEFERFES